jgi:hypothetical protein
VLIAIYGVIRAFNIVVLFVGRGGTEGGGAYGGSASAPVPSAVTVKVSPASVAVGQAATVTWSSALSATGRVAGATR